MAIQHRGLAVVALKGEPERITAGRRRATCCRPAITSPACISWLEQLVAAPLLLPADLTLLTITPWRGAGLVP